MLPTEVEKIWRIRKTKINDSGQDVRLQIHCNTKEVLNVLLSDVCVQYGWRTYWQRSVGKIWFALVDTASVSFRVYNQIGTFLGLVG